MNSFLALAITLVSCILHVKNYLIDLRFMAVKEIVIYTIAACASITVFGFSVHMLIGGLVSPELETTLITIACLAAAGVIGYMVRDVLQRRRSGK